MLKYIVIGAVIVAAIVLLRRLFGRKPIEPFSQQPPKLIPKDGGTVTAEIGGQEFEINAAVLDEVRRFTDGGQKIEAISTCARRPASASPKRKRSSTRLT